MAELAVITKSLHFQLEQVQRLHAYADDIGYGDVLYRISSLYVGESIYGPLKRTKLAQRQFFFWYKP